MLPLVSGMNFRFLSVNHFWKRHDSAPHVSAPHDSAPSFEGASKSGESGSIGFVRVLRTSVDDIYSACLMERPRQRRLADEQPLRRLAQPIQSCHQQASSEHLVVPQGDSTRTGSNRTVTSAADCRKTGRRTKKAYRSLEKRLATLKGRYDSGQNVCH